MADLNLIISGNLNRLKIELSKINLEKISLEQQDEPYRHWLTREAGLEHHKLLAYISMTYSDETIYDIGTHYGNSSLSLSYNPKVKVVSYDIEPKLKIRNKPTNVEYRIGDFTKNPDIVNSPFIFIDVDPHDGIQEKAFHEHFLSIGYKGLVMWDDIGSGDLKKCWDSINQPSVRKVDLTPVGHYSGTGLLIYS